MTVFERRTKQELTPCFLIVASARFRDGDSNTVGINFAVLLLHSIICLYITGFTDVAFKELRVVPVFIDYCFVPTGAGITKFFLSSVFNVIEVIIL